MPLVLPGTGSTSGLPPRYSPTVAVQMGAPSLAIPAVEPTPDGLRALVRWAANGPRRARWSPEQVRAGYCARGPLRILEEGELPFTAPCADLSSLVAVGLD